MKFPPTRTVLAISTVGLLIMFVIIILVSRNVLEAMGKKEWISHWLNVIDCYTAIGCIAIDLGTDVEAVFCFFVRRC